MSQRVEDNAGQRTSEERVSELRLRAVISLYEFFSPGAGVAAVDRQRVLDELVGQVKRLEPADIVWLVDEHGPTHLDALRLPDNVVEISRPPTWGDLADAALAGPKAAEEIDVALFVGGTSLWLGPELVASALEQCAGENIVLRRTQPGAEVLVVPTSMLKGVLPPYAPKPFDAARARSRTDASVVYDDQQQPNLARHGYLGLDVAEGWEYFALAASEGLDSYHPITHQQFNAFWVMNHHHMLRTLSRVDTFCDLEGKRVLEIGASPRNPSLARALLNQFKVKSYVGLNLATFSYDLEDPRAELIESDIHEAGFADEEFDVVFSIAVLEHLPQPDKVLADVARWLKPNGTHYGIYFGFSGPKGHHVIGEPLTRLVPDWAHLTMSAPELTELLEESGADGAEIERTVDLVYTNGRINRVGSAEMVRGIQDCGLEVVYLDGRSNGRFLRGATDAAEQAGRSAEELSVQGLEFLLRKSDFRVLDLADRS